MIDQLRHQGLNRGTRDAPQSDQWDSGKDVGTARGQGEPQKPEGAANKSGKEAKPLSKTLDHRSDEACRNECRARTNRCERKADISAIPAVTIFGIQSPNRRQCIVREIEERDDDGKAKEFRVGAQQSERTERVCHVPGGFGPTLQRKRFGKNKESVQKINQAQARSDPERHTKVMDA